MSLQVQLSSGGNMPNRFDKDYNKKIHDTVRYANARAKRLEKRGIKLFNRPIKVRDLKKRYTTKQAMDKELNLLNKLTVKQGLNPKKLTSWRSQYYGKDVEAAQSYFKARFDKLNRKLGNMPADRTRVELLRDKYNILRQDPSKLTGADLGAYNATMREFYAYPSQRRSGYRGFLKEVDLVMERLQYSKETRDGVFKKLSELDADQFYAMYDDNSIIERVYDLGGSPTNDDFELNTTEENAKEIIDALLEQVGGLVDKYKEW